MTAEADLHEQHKPVQHDHLKTGAQPNYSKPEKQNGRDRNGSSRGWFSRVAAILRRDSSQIRDDLADALEGTADAAGFSSEEKEMLNNVLRLQDARIEDVMTPRAEIDAVDADTGLGDVLHMFEQSGHSRMPVYSDTLDDPRGMVHIRDILAHITKAAHLTKSEQADRKRLPPANLDLKRVSLSASLNDLKLVRKVLFVPASMHVSDLMARMQATRIQMALVIDEYGGTDGLVTLEDLIEMVVGDIEDEHDEEEADLIVETASGVFLCDARAELEDIIERVGDGFEAGELADEADTIGGLVFAMIDRVPVRGEVIEGLGFEFRVVDADPRRIKKIELRRSKRSRN